VGAAGNSGAFAEFIIGQDSGEGDTPDSASSRSSRSCTLGRFLSNDARLPNAYSAGTIGAAVLVRKTEEKGSDVTSVRCS